MKTIRVDEARRSGCGVCVETCPTGAIRLVDNKAQIEQSLCRYCGACLEVCPNGAIFALEEVVRVGPVAAAQVPAPVRTRPVSFRPRPLTALMPVLGTALAFVGREVVPRIVAALLDRRDRQTAPRMTSGTPRRPSAAGYRWRIRYRRGRRG